VRDTVRGQGIGQVADATIDQHSLRDEVLNGLKEIIYVEGFFHANQVPLRDLPMGKACTDHDARDIFSSPQTLEVVIEFNSIHPREAIIQKQETGSGGLHGLKSVTSICDQQRTKGCLLDNTLYQNQPDVFIIFHNQHRFLCLRIVHKNALPFTQVAVRSLFFIISPYYKLNAFFKEEGCLWQEVLETLLETNAHMLHVPVQTSGWSMHGGLAGERVPMKLEYKHA
jgi:hypothetical protein